MNSASKAQKPLPSGESAGDESKNNGDGSDDEKKPPAFTRGEAARSPSGGKKRKRGSSSGASAAAESQSTSVDGNEEVKQKSLGSPPSSPVARSPAQAAATAGTQSATSLQEKWDEMFNRLVKFKVGLRPEKPPNESSLKSSEISDLNSSEPIATD